MNEAAIRIPRLDYATIINNKPSVGIYVRLSDEDRDKRTLAKDESESIQNQKSMLLEYCKERGWDVYDLYCDEDFSGADRNRPDFNRLMKDCESGSVNIVICKTQSRFSRDMTIIEDVMHDKFLQWGVRFVGVVDHVDTDVEGNKKARQINGLINEWYLEDLSANIKRTLNHKKSKGEFCGAFAPYGYIKDPHNKNQLIIDPIAAKIVQEVFTMYNSGQGYQKICQNLNERNVMTPTEYKKSCGENFDNARKREISRTKFGSIWTIHTIFNMVRNEMYTGTLVQGKTGNISYKNQKKVRKPKSEWIVIPDSHEPIIDEHTWETTQNKLKNQTRPQQGSKVKHIFAGKVFCGNCGNSMKKSRYRNRNDEPFKDYFHCRTPWDAPGVCDNSRYQLFGEVEDYILSEINKLLSKEFDAKLIDLRSNEKLNRLSALEKEQNTIVNLLQKKESAIETLYMDRVEGLISKERYSILQEKLESEIESQRKRLSEIGKETHGEGKKTSERDRLLKKYKKVSMLTHEIVDEFIEKIVIEPYDKEKKQRIIKIHWTI